MSEFIRGKCLVRRTTITSTNEPAIIVCGSFIPVYGNSIENINNRDEMWSVEFEVKKSIKYINSDFLQFSPEDFLENVKDIQNPKWWTKKIK